MTDKLLRTVVAAILLLIGFSVTAKTYVVSVGIADYAGYPRPISNLWLTVKDAQSVVDLYKENSASDCVLLLDDNATKAKILKAIVDVFNNATEEDIVVFFFSGHGFTGGFCAYDGNMYYKDVRKAMSRSKCKNKMMFVDACRSGGIRVDYNVSQGDIAAAKKANVMLFLSSRTNENSIERTDMQNGFFTTYLQEGLKGRADADRDNCVTAKELFDFVHSEVSQISGGKQHPVMWGNFDDNMIVMKW